MGRVYTRCALWRMEMAVLPQSIAAIRARDEVWVGVVPSPSAL
jgi:hypothetical protein